MPVSFEVFNDLVMLKSVGQYEWSEMLQKLDEALSEIEDTRRIDIIFDERDASYLPTEEELNEIVARLKKWENMIKKIALIVLEKGQYGMGRLAGAHIDIEYGEGKFQVFYNIEKAKNWLGQKG